MAVLGDGNEGMCRETKMENGGWEKGEREETGRGVT